MKIAHGGTGTIPPLSQQPDAQPGHNSIAAEQLRGFVERVERIDEEIRELNASKSDVYQEAKGRGYDTAVIRWAVKERQLDPLKRSERDDLRDLYARALGMSA